MLDMVEITDANALDVFTDADAVKPIIAAIAAEAAKCKADTSTATGRKTIASAAYKVAQEKTRLDAIGKKLVDHHKEIPKKIDATRKFLRDALDKIRDDVRAPLTAWETAEQERQDRIKAALAEFVAAATISHDATSADLAKRLDELKREAITEQFWNEFVGQAVEARDKAIAVVEQALRAAKAREAQQTELERLKAEAEARARIEREERIAREAAEKAKAEAEARAEREKRAAEEAARREREAAEKRELELTLAAEQAERRAAEAEARARHQAEQEKARAKAEAEAREADKAHRARVNVEARDALIALGLTKELAEMCITAIAKRSVPHVAINY